MNAVRDRTRVVFFAFAAYGLLWGLYMAALPVTLERFSFAAQFFAAEQAIRQWSGSETTGVTIFDLTSMHAKTGIANRRLKPTLGLLDPENTRTMPGSVAAVRMQSRRALWPRTGWTTSAAASVIARITNWIAIARSQLFAPSCFRCATIPRTTVRHSLAFPGLTLWNYR